MGGRAPLLTGSPSTAFRARHRLQELRAWCDRRWACTDAAAAPHGPDDVHQFADLLDPAAVAVPAGLTVDGRPLGVTLLGPAFSESRLISTARELFEEAA